MNRITFIVLSSIILYLFLLPGCTDPDKQIKKVESDKPAENSDVVHSAENIEPDRSGGLARAETSEAPNEERDWQYGPRKDIELDENPLPVTRFNPEYPEEARRNKIEGNVWVYVLVNSDGTVVTANIDKSDYQGFDDVTLHAITKWKFKPAMKDGKAVLAWVRVPVEFKLTN